MDTSQTTLKSRRCGSTSRKRGERLHARSTVLELQTETQTSDEVKELCVAAHSGEVDYVRDLLDMGGVDPNATDHNQMTALHYAAMHAREEVIKLLVQRGSNPNASDLKGGFTPLHWVIIKVNPLTNSTNHVDQSIIALYRGGANVNCTDFNLCTPLHIAAQRGHADCIDTLIRLGADPERKDVMGRSCFQVAKNECIQAQMSRLWYLKKTAIYGVLDNPKCITFSLRAQEVVSH